MSRTPMQPVSEIKPEAVTLLMLQVAGRDYLGHYIPSGKYFTYRGMNGEKYLFPEEDAQGWKYVRNQRSKYYE